MERVKQLESALAQANSSQYPSVAETPIESICSRPSTADEDGRGTPKSAERQDERATRDLMHAGQESGQNLENGIHAHIVFASRLFEKNWYHKGTPIISRNGLEWIASRTNHSTATLRAYLSLGYYSQSYCKVSSLREHAFPGELWDLPDKSLIHKWSNALSHMSWQMLFPPLDKWFFEETVDTAYRTFEGIHASHLHISARACFWAVCAIMSHLKVSGQVVLSLNSSICAARAGRFLELSNGPANLELLQALILLVSSLICVLYKRPRIDSLLASINTKRQLDSIPALYRYIQPLAAWFVSSMAIVISQ